MPELEVVRGPAGRSLVRDGPRVFVVPDALAHELEQAGSGADCRWRDLVGASAGRRPASPLWLRVVLMPAVASDALARRLAPLAATGALAGLALCGAAGLAFGAPTLPGSAAEIAAGTALFVLSALWHEVGHAAALRREGLPAGRIGVALLWVLPVLTCDVTAAALLGRRGRVRVDLAGMVFQFAAAGALAALATAWPPAGHGAAGALAAVIWNAIPLLRTDGHWLLLDLLGLSDLDAPPPAAWGRRGWRQVAVSLWRLLTAASLLTLVLWLPWRADRWFDRTAPAACPAPLIAGLRALAWLLALAGGWRAARRARVLWGALVRDLALTPPAP